MRTQQEKSRWSCVAILKTNTDIRATRTKISANTDQFPDRAGSKGPVHGGDIITLPYRTAVAGRCWAYHLG
jgi:hypothetical protein